MWGVFNRFFFLKWVNYIKCCIETDDWPSFTDKPNRAEEQEQLCKLDLHPKRTGQAFS